MKKQKKRKLKIRKAQEYALFHSGLFGHKVQRDRKKYKRKLKHKTLTEYENSV